MSITFWQLFSVLLAPISGCKVVFLHPNNLAYSGLFREIAIKVVESKLCIRVRGIAKMLIWEWSGNC